MTDISGLYKTPVPGNLDCYVRRVSGLRVNDVTEMYLRRILPTPVRMSNRWISNRHHSVTGDESRFDFRKPG